MLVCLTLFCFVGCNRVISKDSCTVEAIVIGTEYTAGYYKNEWVYYDYAYDYDNYDYDTYAYDWDVEPKGHWVPVWHDAIYAIHLEYNEKQYVLNNKSLYNTCVGNNGIKVFVTLNTWVYEDGDKDEWLAV